eukprot:gene7277-8088_t
MEDAYTFLEDKVEKLKRKLKDLELSSNSMSGQIVSLKMALQKTVSWNKTLKSSSLTLPSIYSYLPHLLSRPKGLEPFIQVRSNKPRKATLAFGIPSISRQHHSYLPATLQSLLQGLSEEDKDDVVLIAFIGDTSKDKVKRRVKELELKFPEAIEEGVLEIIAPHQDFYPDMSDLPLTFNDSPDRVKWRTKQNLDFAYLMMYAHNKAPFYVQLEDDIVASPSYASTIKSFVLQQESNDWFILEFSILGFIGKLFKSTDVIKFVDFILMFHKNKPVDWLLDHILTVEICNPEKDNKHCTTEKNKLKIRFKPSLFQHVGKESSLKGKRQALVDKDFKSQSVFQAHLNPKAIVKSTFETYQRYTPEEAYLGRTFFWGLTPHAGDVIRFCFKHPTLIERFKFRSGMSDHPGDILTNATVEVLTVAQKDKADAKKNTSIDSNEIPTLGDKMNKIKFEYKSKDYVKVGSFSTIGVASGKIGSYIGPVAEIRIRVIQHKNENWVALSEIHITERKQTRLNRI